ncbi:MAG: ABC-type Fe(3+)-siderophore transport system permease component [Candidatus Methanohalarchaeum thermophilum]|uniref:ABC-type Fe(3+)-siderophore transport system permease component n=1 Tax=Methanohalarchaeum thermophilum TaxID=1903181 RepID=A0A1Q6DSI2_METT1|nr:MAG: ABC-type Fe(3+)-siderophore transport system permease component [Candidatus Methanohalarchaeum thermophilum]
MNGETERSQEIKKYKKILNRKTSFLLISSFLLFISILLSFLLGPVPISIKDIAYVFMGKGTEIATNVLWNIRILRVLTAIVAGIGLSISGAVMQSVLKNPLASPYTLGISHAAAFGAAFAVIFLGAGTAQTGGTIVLNNPYIVPISAFFWSLVCTLIILLLAKLKKASPATMILTGIALGSLFTAGYSSMQYFADQTQLSTIVYWTFGDIGRATWTDLGLMTLFVAPSIAYFTYKGWDYNILDSGDDVAKSLGINVEKLRIKGMLLSSFITSLIISFVGIIGFIGLVVPHIIRKIIGGDEKFLIPSSCLIGALILLVSDTGARTAFTPIVLPVGIVTSFLGAPLFIYLVIKGREYW